MNKNSMLLKVFAAILLGMLAGWLSGPEGGLFGVPFLKFYSLFGQLFLNALTLVVVPLVVASIITGTARIGADGSFGKLGAKTLGYFLLNCALAVLIGIAIISLFEPGSSKEFSQKAAKLISANALPDLQKEAQGDTFDKFASVFLKLIPPNIIAAASQGQMLGLIFFSLLFGYFITKIESSLGSIMLAFWKGLFEIMMQITHLVMRFLPIGVFALMAKVVATTGFEAFRALALFFGLIALGFAIHMFIVLPLLLKFIARVSPIAHFRAVAPALLTAFTTSSSAATLPVTIECMEERAFVSNRIVSFTIPLGTSLNLAATGLYTCASVLFIAQVYGIELSFATQFLIVLMSLLTCMGMAGIPSASLVAIILILHTLNLPADAISLIIAVERILDMLRTTVNVFGNTCTSILVARSEGEQGVLKAPLKTANAG